MTTRQYSSRSQQTTLTGAITSGATSMTVVSGTGLLGGVTIPAGRTFTLVIDVDTALEEIVDATAVSTNTFTITRGRDGSTAQDHSAGAVVRHMAIGRDYRDANLHAEADASYNDGSGNAHTMHGIGAGEGVVVGTLKTQTLTNKTLTAPTISDPTITGTASAGAVLVFEGATADAYETTLTVVDPTQDNTITLPNTTGTVVIADATQTLSNKTLGTNLNAGGYTITNLATPVNASDAVRKDFADAQVAAAATSAASAATSATSAAASATAAATSASSAATSASSALTSANSAATSASTMAASVAAAATSAASAATSATAAATSATSAAASATAAATSASSAATSASNAVTSANSASTSATAAATSATSAAASATAAATSATSAAASVTAAATSATSAAASATAAASSATAAAFSATSAEAAWDSFDDRYLGPKASPPTVDNDGNPLTAGVIYYNTGDGNMYVWSGSVWSVFTSTGDITAVTVSSPITGGGASGSVNIGIQAGTTAQSGAVQLTDSTASTSVTTAATPNSVKSAYDLADAAVPKSTFNAKGDILSASANDTPVILTVGTNGQYLKADSSTTSGLAWSTVDALPSQTGNSGKYLTTNGTTASWAAVATDPTPSVFMLMGA